MREDSSEAYGNTAEQTCGSEQGQREDEGKSEMHGMKPRREVHLGEGRLIRKAGCGRMVVFQARSREGFGYRVYRIL